MKNGSTEGSPVLSYSIAPGVVVQIQDTIDVIDFADDVLDTLETMVELGAIKQVANGEIGLSTVSGLVRAKLTAVRHLRGIMPYLSKAARYQSGSRS